MATNTEELTNCIICTATFTDPQVLPCDHTFCKNCVDRLTEVGTIKCPKCKSVCRSGDVRYDFRLNTFLEALAERTEHLTRASRVDVIERDIPPPPADKCSICASKLRVVNTFCHQCQQWMCNNCKYVHGKLSATKDHVHTKIAQSYAIAKHRVTQQIQKLQEQSGKLTSVVEQSEKTMLEVEAAQIQAMQQSQKLRAHLHDDVNRYVDSINVQIDSFCRRELTANNVKKLRKGEKLNHLHTLRKEMEELMTQPDREVLVAAKSMISRAEDAASFQADVTVSMPRLSVTRNPDWSVDGALKVLLQSAESHQAVAVPGGRPLQLAEVAQRQWMQEKELTFDSDACSSMRVINDQLWCCTTSGIFVLEDDADSFCLMNLTTPSESLSKVNDVAKLSDGSIVIAADGLYQASITGEIQERISSVPFFTSVAVYHGNIYAAGFTTDDRTVVYVFKQSGDGWHKAYSFKVTINSWVTLSVQNNVIKCCSRRDHQITVHNLAGKLLRTHGTHGTDDAGDFRTPYICAIDHEGSVLVADHWNQRLQVMRENGECNILRLQPPAFHHRSAALHNNHLFVTTSNANRADSKAMLYRYRCT